MGATFGIAYFESWIDPVAAEILGAEPAVALARLSYAAPLDTSLAAFDRVHGYQISAGTEIRGPWRVTEELVSRHGNLLVVSTTGAGYDTIDVDACTRHGIIVCNQSGQNKTSVAEHVLGFMIVLSKKIAHYTRRMPQHSFEGRFDFLGNEVSGKTVGIVGLGNIGGRLAELCAGMMNMRVLACDPYLDAAAIRGRRAEKVSLEQLLERSDFVSVNCPLTAETRGMFGAAEFARMRPHAYFITTARGGIHDEAALVEALAAGRIAGAGIDVFTVEPPPKDHPLLSFDNVVVSPHNAGLTVEAMHNLAASAAAQWIDIAAGRRPPRLVNPEAWPAYVARRRRVFPARA